MTRHLVIALVVLAAIGISYLALFRGDSRRRP